MAKSHALATRQPVVVFAPPRRRSVGRRRAARVVRVVAKRVGRRAVKSLPLTSVGLGAAALGYAKSQGWLDKIPEVMGSKLTGLGVAGFLAVKYATRYPEVRAAGYAAVAVAAFDIGNTKGGGTSGWDDGDEQQQQY